MTLPRPLTGVRVLDFTWVRAGPWATRWLGAFGAEIIKIEWPENLDILRSNRMVIPPGVEPGPNAPGQFADTNVNKRGLTLNVRTPKGLEIARRLAAIADIVMENFSSRVMQKWGLGYEDLKKLRALVIPGVITTTPPWAPRRRLYLARRSSRACQASRRPAGAGRTSTIPVVCMASWVPSRLCAIATPRGRGSTLTCHR
jgi:crotonobetainyl-CoA:carnitine CoA-transferase CaiB-like acyl-CoA transferase